MVLTGCKEGRPPTLDAVARKASPSLHHVPHADNLTGHVLHTASMPPRVQLRSVRDGVGGHLVAFRRQRLQQSVVRIVVADEESETDVAAVRVLPSSEYPLVKHLVVDHSHSIVEADGYHLRGGVSGKTSRNVRSSTATAGEAACFGRAGLCRSCIDRPNLS